MSVSHLYVVFRETSLRVFCPFLVFFLNFFLMFIFERERERQSMNGGGAEREVGTESEAGSRLVSAETDLVLEPTNCEIVT